MVETHDTRGGVPPHAPDGADHTDSQACFNEPVPRPRTHPVTAAPGQAIGAYRIERELGAGGFGVVYRASQRMPVRRDVALKLLRPEVASLDALRRFTDERQLLARMDHPSIVKVHDAGITDDGRAFIAMELVEGPNILDYVRAERPALRDRVRIMADACRAVHHAHQRAVIHRDVKPSNILVSRVDGRPRPRIIDFGIAKSLAGDAPAPEAHQTQQGAFIGTPAYMTPAQLMGDPSADVRTDVYALGVVLCEVLTGGIPRDMTTMTARLPLETPAEAPSRLAGRSGARADTRVPPVPAGSLRGELDRVVLKATAWEPEHRYDSAAAMADDLERFLRGEPVLAAGPSPLYRFRKFIARNRVASVLTLITAVALVAGVAIAFAGQARALAAERAAARDNARSAFISEFLLSDVIAAVDPDVAKGRDITIREVLDEAVAQAHARFAADPPLLLDTLDLLADAYFKLGRYADAADAYAEAAALSADLNGPNAERSIRLRLDTATALYPDPPRHADAVALQRAALADAQRHLGPDHPITLRAQLEAIQSEADQHHNFELASRVHQRIIDLGLTESPLYLHSLRTLATACAKTGRFELELPLRRQADAAARERYGPDHSMRLVCMSQLVNALLRSGLPDEAADLAEDSLDRHRRVYGAVHGEVITAGHAATRALAEAGRHGRAVQTATQTEAAARELWGEGSVAHMTARKFLAGELVASGRAEEGLGVLLAVYEAQRAQWGDDSAMVADARGLLAEAYAAMGRHAEAIPHAEAALARMSEGVPYFKYTALRAACLIELGAVDEALAALRSLYDEATAMGARDPARRRIADQVLRDHVLPPLLRLSESQGAAEAQRYRAELKALTGAGVAP